MLKSHREKGGNGGRQAAEPFERESTSMGAWLSEADSNVVRESLLSGREKRVNSVVDLM
jgi:hypothetical protein